MFVRRLIALAIVGSLISASACLFITRPRIQVNRISTSAAAQAFQQGAEAAQLGLSITACPYALDDAARRAWRAGWRWYRGEGS